MKFSLISNGADSLSKARESIERFAELEYQFAYHHLKDALIFLNHGTEMLLKHILSSKNESLIFDNLKEYIEAKEELFKLRKSPKGETEESARYKNIFDVPKGKKLKTVSFISAIERVHYLCDINITDQFKDSVYYINNYRNKITHHTIELTPTEERELATRLKAVFDQVVDFFMSNIPDLLEKIDRSRKFELTAEEWLWVQEALEDEARDRAMSRLDIDIE